MAWPSYTFRDFFFLGDYYMLWSARMPLSLYNSPTLASKLEIETNSYL
jgi:hypothetical protein